MKQLLAISEVQSPIRTILVLDQKTRRMSMKTIDNDLICLIDHPSAFELTQEDIESFDNKNISVLQDYLRKLRIWYKTQQLP